MYIFLIPKLSFNIYNCVFIPFMNFQDVTVIVTSLKKIATTIFLTTFSFIFYK